MSSSRWLRPIAFALGGGLLAWGGSLLIPDRYTSSAMIRLRVEPYPSADTINQAYQDTVSRQSLKSVIVRLNLYPEERDRLPLEDVLEAMKKEDFWLDIQKDRLMKLSFAYRDRGVAQKVANELAKIMSSASEANFREQPAMGRIVVTNAARPGEASRTLAFWRPSRYVAHATLEVKDRKSPAIAKEVSDKRIDDFVANALSPIHLAMLVAGDRFAARPIEREDLDSPFPDSHQTAQSTESSVSLDDLRTHLRMDRLLSVVIVKFTHSNAKVAKRTVDHLITQLIDEHSVMPECELAPPVASVGYVWDQKEVLHLHRARRPPVYPKTLVAARTEPCREPNAPKWLDAIDVLDPASLPEKPDGPSRSIFAITGLFLGLGLWATNFKS